MRLNKICVLMCFLMNCPWFSSFSLWGFHGNLILFNFVIGRESKPAYTVKFLFKEFFCASHFVDVFSSSQILLHPGASWGRGEGDKTVLGWVCPLPQVTPPAQGPHTLLHLPICTKNCIYSFLPLSAYLANTHFSEYMHVYEREVLGVSTASDVSREQGVGDVAAGNGWGGVGRVEVLINCCHNHRQRKDLLWKVFLVSDTLTSILTATVIDWGQKRGRFAGKGNILC